MNCQAEYITSQVEKLAWGDALPFPAAAAVRIWEGGKTCAVILCGTPYREIVPKLEITNRKYRFGAADDEFSSALFALCRRQGEPEPERGAVVDCWEHTDWETGAVDARMLVYFYSPGLTEQLETLYETGARKIALLLEQGGQTRSELCRGLRAGHELGCLPFSIRLAGELIESGDPGGAADLLTPLRRHGHPQVEYAYAVAVAACSVKNLPLAAELLAGLLKDAPSGYISNTLQSLSKIFSRYMGGPPLNGIAISGYYKRLDNLLTLVFENSYLLELRRRCLALAIERGSVSRADVMRLRGELSSDGTDAQWLRGSAASWSDEPLNFSLMERLPEAGDEPEDGELTLGLRACYAEVIPVGTDCPDKYLVTQREDGLQGIYDLEKDIFLISPRYERVEWDGCQFLCYEKNRKEPYKAICI